jgi:hypothetical protein
MHIHDLMIFDYSHDYDGCRQHSFEELLPFRYLLSIFCPLCTYRTPLDSSGTLDLPLEFALPDLTLICHLRHLLRSMCCRAVCDFTVYVAARMLAHSQLNLLLIIGKRIWLRPQNFQSTHEPAAKAAHNLRCTGPATTTITRSWP